jgi:hypothetical protein
VEGKFEADKFKHCCNFFNQKDTFYIYVKYFFYSFKGLTRNIDKVACLIICSSSKSVILWEAQVLDLFTKIINMMVKLYNFKFIRSSYWMFGLDC